ncbi:MAG: 23S rRNA (adenine(2030)-N(6))-methyltransferase RlmJ [Hyphomicrobiales bacterium]|nr:23S rRNA (adenine(2030)-N(6))-methyltransferase RlmJ [Hyphomicrobiales bacterium]
MNYRPAFHAGNFADVVKHITLARIIAYLRRKDKPFRVFDTHAGRGRYDLTSEEALKTDEWKLGVKKVLAAAAAGGDAVPGDVTDLIAEWLEIVQGGDGGGEGDTTYPGSPRITHAMLRASDRMALYEMHPEDSVALAAEFDGDYKTRVYNTDGWQVSVSPIPPKEGRGLILCDPPFEDGKDFDRMIKLLNNSSRRWAGGVVALWYPVKRRDHTDEWLGTLRELKFRDLLNIELYIREPRSASMLNGCGIVILNPPYVLRQEMETLLPWLAETMKQDRGWGYRIQDLSGR